MKMREKGRKDGMDRTIGIPASFEFFSAYDPGSE